MNHRRNPQRTTLAGLLLILAIAVAAGGFGDESATMKQAKAASLASSGTELLIRNFSILRDGDAANEAWQARIPKDLAEAYSLAPALARTTTTGESGVAITAIPGENGVCFTSPSVAGCAPLPEALTSGIAVVEFCVPDLADGETRLTALLPDNATPATVTGPNGESAHVTVSQNALVHTQPGGPTTLSAPTLVAPVQLPQGDEEVACG